MVSLTLAEIMIICALIVDRPPMDKADAETISQILDKLEKELARHEKAFLISCSPSQSSPPAQANLASSTISAGADHEDVSRP